MKVGSRQIWPLAAFLVWASAKVVRTVAVGTMMRPENPLVDLAELIHLPSGNKTLWRRAIYRGELPHTKFASRERGKVWVRLTDADKYLEAQRVR